MAVNAYGPTRLIQQALPLLRKGSIKRILTLSSEAGRIQSGQFSSWLAPDRYGRAHTVAPYDSAQGIYHWGIEQDWSPNDLTYIDYQGKPQLW